MTMQLARKAIKLFSNPNAPKSQNRHNQRQWIQAMERLGDRHLLAVPVQRKTPERGYFGLVTGA